MPTCLYGALKVAVSFCLEPQYNSIAYGFLDPLFGEELGEVSACADSNAYNFVIYLGTSKKANKASCVTVFVFRIDGPNMPIHRKRRIMSTAPFLEVLGTGDSESLRFWNSNMLVQSNSKTLLLDCGSTIKYALGDRGRLLSDVDAVYLSHVHGDHCFGLERLGFESRYIYGRKPALYATQEVLDSLWEDTLKGCMGHSAEGPNTLESFFNVIVVESAFNWEGLSFELFATTHTGNKPCYGLHINNSLSWTSDTNAIPDLEEHCCPLVLHDICTTNSHPAHATLTELKEEYSPQFLKKLWAIHYPDDIDDYRLEFEEHLAGVAEQGQKFCLV